jgi:hypothetical protein
MNIHPLLTRILPWRPRLAPSLYDLIPHANALPRSIPRTESLIASAITGTARYPSTTTDKFLPVRSLRTEHWKDDWRRILDAQQRAVFLPPVELIKVDAKYFVVDGHKRVAAARKAGAAVDAIVVELRQAGASLSA